MEFDLALILTLLTAFSGIVVAFNRFYYAQHLETTNTQAAHAVAVLIEYSRSFFPVLLIVLIIRSFIFEPFRIPSGSMMPTLVQGDYIFVKKYQYGLRLPVTETKILETGSPQRGDVVVFRLPSDPGINYIKRVVGLPGDEIVYSRQRLSVNGEPAMTVPSDNIEVRGAALYVDDELLMPVLDERQPYSGFRPYTETLGGREHSILLELRPDDSFVGRYRVPDGHYFMMGDNRDRSKDSRYIGAIPESHLVGEAVLIWMHMDGIEWPNWNRIGTSIE